MSVGVMEDYFTRQVMLNRCVFNVSHGHDCVFLKKNLTVLSAPRSPGMWGWPPEIHPNHRICTYNSGCLHCKITQKVNTRLDALGLLSLPGIPDHQRSFY